ncbi:MAG TPA: glycine zipper family protein [Stellaceae bacterium]|nr:glycine zipper family protein [Stellaceae bacterium]
MTCETYASQRTGGAQPQQAANNSAVGSAVIGTAIGAAAGAALGAAAGNAGLGAAAGAGAGLLGGTAVGSQNAQYSSDALQQRYDIAYSQCMVTAGNRVPAPEAPVAYGAPAPGYYVAPGPAYVAGPTVVVGGGYYHRPWHRW